MKEFWAWYISIGIFWPCVCLYVTIIKKYKRTWKTYVIGTPFNAILWPISMILAAFWFWRD